MVQEQALPLEFTGSASEFFKIWIVNILLTIITLGLYSPWAKVRTRRYFYNNTFLDKSHFDYLADPVKILKGRLLLLLVLFIVSLISVIPLLNALVTLIFILLMPWFIIRALKFNLYNTAYRNIRFQFKGEYGQALLTFVGLPFLIPFTLGFIYPYFVKQSKRFIIDNSAYGASPFQMNAATGSFYAIYAIVLIILILLLAVIDGLAGHFQPTDPAMVGALVILFYPLALLLYAYLITKTTNLVFNHTSLDQCRFQSELKVGPMCWLYFSNAVAIILSLGLLIPWAKIRLTRYRLTHLTLITAQGLDQFVAAEQERCDAIGEEAVDLFDIDFGL
jgi:uncharacterized membrane protein YjgN (DUF898 family)